MAKSNQKILTDFLETIIQLVSKGTSDTYAAMVIMKFTERSSAKFPFARYIHVDSNKIKINPKINSVDPKLIANFINKEINTLFSDLFRHLLKREMGAIVYDELKEIGVKI
ncbi:hypothetical protein CMO93_03455 [Candidatus Woesearchaeota archaeon]|jgi:hypothetical protein|nr:hypothetical protein [Candidatus Woesearchaeota archaeon]|tara:strand:- start:257 stop:589 length:333 start_codon:yes stop_codon:yes gene_type:complete